MYVDAQKGSRDPPVQLSKRRKSLSLPRVTHDSPSSFDSFLPSHVTPFHHHLHTLALVPPHRSRLPFSSTGGYSLPRRELPALMADAYWRYAADPRQQPPPPAGPHPGAVGGAPTAASQMVGAAGGQQPMKRPRPTDFSGSPPPSVSAPGPRSDPPVVSIALRCCSVAVALLRSICE